MGSRLAVYWLLSPPDLDSAAGLTVTYWRARSWNSTCVRSRAKRAKKLGDVTSQCVRVKKGRAGSVNLTRAPFRKKKKKKKKKSSRRLYPCLKKKKKKKKK